MKLLKNPGSTIVSANQPTAPPPVVIIITDTGNQHLTSPTSSVIDSETIHIPTGHHQNRLQHAIRAEQDYLKETGAEFLEAIGTFLGAMFHWLVWRVVLPVTVVGMLLVALT